MSDAHKKMDRMYRYQRYFYDLTRRYYLLGRDQLLRRIPVRKGGLVLEIGCGTARNLIKLARQHPEAYFYGLDASAEMLETANTKIAKIGIRNIKLKRALADDFSWKETFGHSEPFDTVYFSYSLSMIPTWRESIVNALKNLKPNQVLFIVDFYDQRELPDWFSLLLKKWLSLFHVRYQSDLIPYLEQLEKESKGRLSIEPQFKSYSYIAEFKKTD